ncbi:hypothetical protein [Brachybacterium alimentarium]|uniref:hypothetical protein n=1 Tax=Brachybacterium alimentarium TaxID=47845 RepID=UPI00159683EF|nr:hypothetical protein [Brachybacterium alimentarium]
MRTLLEPRARRGGVAAWRRGDELAWSGHAFVQLDKLYASRTALCIVDACVHR